MIWTNRWNILAFSGGMVTKLQDQGKEEQYACCIRILKWYSILKSLYSNWTDVTDITIDYECMLKFSGDLTHYGTMFVQLAGLRKHDVHHDFRMAPPFTNALKHVLLSYLTGGNCQVLLWWRGQEARYQQRQVQGAVKIYYGMDFGGWQDALFDALWYYTYILYTRMYVYTHIHISLVLPICAWVAYD